MKKKPSVCILGAPLPNSNMGVQALAASLVTLFERVRPGIEITILCGGPYGTRTENVYVGPGFKCVTVCNYRMSPRAKWGEHLLLTLLGAILYRMAPLAVLRRRTLVVFPILDRLLNATFVGDIRGGDSFSDIYGFRKFISGNLACLVVLLLGKDLVLLPQTYGPFKTWLARFIAQRIIRRSKCVLARDAESLALVRHLLNQKAPVSNVELCPDVAFFLEPSAAIETAIEPALPEGSDCHLIGFNVSGLLYHGGYNRDNMFGLRHNYQETVFKVLKFLLNRPDTHVLLLPHMLKSEAWHVENDLHASRHLLARLDPSLKSRVYIAAGNYDQHQVKALIGRCEFFIGSRMHACIAALSQGIPTVGIAYSRKFKGVFETVGVPQAALDATSLSQEEMLSRISDMFTSACNIRINLQKRLPRLKTHLAQSFGNLFDADSGEEQKPFTKCTDHLTNTSELRVKICDEV